VEPDADAGLAQGLGVGVRHEVPLRLRALRLRTVRMRMVQLRTVRMRGVAPPAGVRCRRRQASAASVALAASTTASVVMPYSLYSTPPSAEAPKVSTETDRPLLPMSGSQVSASPASTLTRAVTDEGSTCSR